MALITPFLESLGRQDPLRPEIVEMRERLLKTLLLTFSALAALPVIFGTYMAFQAGQVLFAALYPLLFVLLLVCTLLQRQLSYRLRGGVLLLSGMGIGIADIFRVGLSGVGLEIVIAFTVIGTVLFGVRLGLVLLGLSVVSIALAGAGFVLGLVNTDVATLLTSHSVVAWLTAGILFTLFTFVLILSPEILRRRLQEALQEEERKTHDLTRANQQLRPRRRSARASAVSVNSPSCSRRPSSRRMPACN